MKIISWNVNGVNSCANKGLIDLIKKEDADIYCFQEIKCSSEKIKELFNFKSYEFFSLFAEKKGYSGVSVLSKIKPISVIEGIGSKVIDKEGRIITLEFDKVFLINSYFPHAHRQLKRLSFKLRFNNAFVDFCRKLRKDKPLIIASDFNVAHREIDLRNPKQNEKNAGFTVSERNWFDRFLKDGYIDTFREFVSEGGQYTWWTYRHNARLRNIGWRIDYFVVSNELKNKLKGSYILKDAQGSDHCPIGLEINL